MHRMKPSSSSCTSEVVDTNMILIAFIILDVAVCVLAITMMVLSRRQSKDMKNVDRHMERAVKQLSDIDTSVDKCRYWIKVTAEALTKISNEQRKEGENDV